MRILHFYPRHDAMAAQYVETLRKAMDGYATVHTAATLADFRKEAKELRPDIVHIHGCWRWANALAARTADNVGARLVFSPHGGLEPWIVKQDFWRSRLPHLLAYQRRMIGQANAVVVMGRMEAGCLGRAKLNPRIEIVRNSLVTSSITPEEMGRGVHAVYRKVLDSFTRPLMTEATATALRGLVKAGLAGDAQWLDNEEFQAVNELQPEAWRQLLLHAAQEGTLATVRHGIEAAALTPPSDIDPEATPHYEPRRHGKKDHQLDTRGDDDTDRLVHALHSAHKLQRQGALTEAHVVALAAMTRQSQADEDRLLYRLKTQSLLPFARRMMAVMEELTGLEEGLMPIAKLADKRAYAILSSITNHNEIL